MYQYSELDQTLVNQRVEQFRDQTKRFLAGQLSEQQYLPLRLQNGLYVQRFAPMLRIAIPYGTLSSTQLRKLADITRRYDRGFGHFTTRTNLQLNWPKLEEVPEILAELAEVQMHAIQTSGNCIRNTTTDALAGVAADEIEDPRPWCEIIRQWSTFHPEFAFLPRKFKIAVSASAKDRAATRVHDIGLHLRHDANGETSFDVIVGGGLGRTPVIGTLIREALPWQHLLSYQEAILRVYNRLGRRDNKYKARIKILLRETGAEAFTAMVEKEWASLKDGELTLNAEQMAEARTWFTSPSYADTVDSQAFEQAKSNDARFALWAKNNLRAHKQAGYHAVVISLKAPAEVPGDCSHQQMDLVAKLADDFSASEIRVMHEQNLVLTDVQDDQLYNVWQQLDAAELATPNIDKFTDMICCPGLDYCALANAGSLGVALELNERFEDLDYLQDLGDLRLNMSGCMNGCGHHSVGNIGILGVDKKGDEWYQLTLGGSSRNDARLGDRLGAAIARDGVVDAVMTLLDVYVKQREGEENFMDTYLRVGVTPFKEAVYG
ncbi:MAG: nitrite/sulfite reductase [Oceanococcus sp.]